MREDWTECTLGDFIQHRGESLNPQKHLNETLELYSIPNHAIKKPEIKLGKDIGSSKQVIGNNWVLLSRINPHLNRSWVVKSDSELTKIASSEWVKFPPNIALNPEFIGYFLTKTQLKNYMCLNVSGVGGSLTRANKNAINIFQFYLPPLVEQKAIVKKIEALFSSLDSGIADLKKAQEQLVIYRQAVLKKAFEGINKETSLEYIKAESLIGLVRSSGLQNAVGEGVAYLKMDKIDMIGNLNLEGLVYVEANDEEIKKYSLKTGDILLNTRNSYELVGKSGVVRNIKETLVFNNNIMRIRVKDNFNPYFICYQLISPFVRKQMEQYKKATTSVCALYQRNLFTLKLKNVNLETQNQIVKEIESRLSVCDKVEESIKESLEKAQALRQSILKKAFEGKLLSEEEIAKCKAHKDYEPASVLLERIKKEKLKKNN